MTTWLSEFELEPNVYRLGQYSPVSIRDQVVRANFLVHHLVESKRLAKTTRLVVIGAGAAGLTTALAATRLGVVDVTLLEAAGAPMPLQARSASRWLDPVQYDWPATHWRAGVWPLFETAPRRFTAVTFPFPALSADVAEQWALLFQSWLTRAVGFGMKAHFHVEAQPWRNTAGHFSITWRDVRSGAVSGSSADLIVVALGFGTEHAAVALTSNPGADFQGLDFWADDQFQAPDMGIAHRQNKVLVSGSGDGALQDFLRLCTGVRAARDIMEVVDSSTAEQRAWKDLFSNLWHWEDHAGRSRHLVTSVAEECELLRRLHLRHQEAVDAFASSSEWIVFTDWLDAKLFARSAGAVELLAKCEHFSWCYPLNRTVVLLVLRYLSERGVQAFRPFTALKSTEHLAAGACGLGCWGHTHSVELAVGVDCETSPAQVRSWAATGSRSESVDGLVIRHGIDPPSFGTVAFEKLKPQTVPLHLP